MRKLLTAVAAILALLLLTANPAAAATQYTTNSRCVSATNTNYSDNSYTRWLWDGTNRRAIYFGVKVNGPAGRLVDATWQLRTGDGTVVRSKTWNSISTNTLHTAATDYTGVSLRATYIIYPRVGPNYTYTVVLHTAGFTAPSSNVTGCSANITSP